MEITANENGQEDLQNKDNSDLVFDVFRKIHVPGEEHDGIISIYGYRTNVDYLR